MKKNISINISGIIFHIEEDGYEKLKAYLESINSYFSSFDDSGEIITDIESRIAEKTFLIKNVLRQRSNKSRVSENGTIRPRNRRVVRFADAQHRPMDLGGRALSIPPSAVEPSLFHLFD